MQPFLDKLAEELQSKYGEKISALEIVFPSRRAGIYFKKYLSSRTDKPIWSPVTCGIADFISENSDNLVADELTLIFELYDVYKKHAPEVTFDKFYPWGEIILRDFDEIDKNLASAEYLFRVLKEHKQVEEDFELNLTDIEGFYRFWNTFSSKDVTKLQEEFIKTWEILGKVYTEFKASLECRKICYEGMAYRSLHNKVKSKKFSPGYEKIIFAGFNQLNKCESSIINELLSQGKAEVYFDGDKYYTDDKVQEAGKFLRDKKIELGISELNWIENDLLTTAKKVNILGAPLHVSQAKALGRELSKLKPEELPNTAVVLPDDSMLIPVLNSLPENINAVNITMGYAFKNSKIYMVFEQLRNLIKNSKQEDKTPVYYHEDVLSILLNPIVKQSLQMDVSRIIQAINKRNIIYVSENFLNEFLKESGQVGEIIFRACTTAEESLGKIIDLLEYFEENMPKGKNFVYEKEFLNKAFTELNRLSGILTGYNIETNVETFWEIVLEAVSRMKVPFSGEPLEGIQIMGMLETRQLDFENVYILSVNEDILPREQTGSSFIPYAIRKAFRLPVNEDFEAATAYNFYRLLQKARNITLLYNTEPGEIYSGEKSRFIMQVENELAVKNPLVKREMKVMQANIELPARKEITVEKSPEILEILKKEKRFSASTLAQYINCPLQFYLKKVAKLKEEESAEEYFSSGAFGSLFHQLMEVLYKPLEGKIVKAGDIDTLSRSVDNNYDELWETACKTRPEFAEFARITQGKNLLYKAIIQKLILKVLENDREQVPFTVLKIEEKSEQTITIEAGNEKIDVPLYGRLDRVELKDGIARIIDYKTGNAVKKSQPAKVSDEEHINRMFYDVKRKENFQQLFYALLYLGENKDSKLKVGMYTIKDMSEGIFWFENEPISPEKKLLFESKLKDMLGRIFDSTTPFKQTSDKNRCKYCPFKSLCYRD